jgi:hypothetical protein
MLGVLIFVLFFLMVIDLWKLFCSIKERGFEEIAADVVEGVESSRSGL